MYLPPSDLDQTLLRLKSLTTRPDSIFRVQVGLSPTVIFPYLRFGNGDLLVSPSLLFTFEGKHFVIDRYPGGTLLVGVRFRVSVRKPTVSVGLWVTVTHKPLTERWIVEGD